MAYNKGKDLATTENKKALEELEKEHPEIKNMKLDDKMAMLKVVQSFSGPLPPPSLMSSYASIDSSFPERIMKMAEKEQEQRHQLNKELIKITKTAQYLTAILVCIVAFAGYKALVLNYPRCAVIIFGITIVALLTAYLGSNKKDKDNK